MVQNKNMPRISILLYLSLSDGRVKEDIGHHNDGFHFPSFLFHGFHFFFFLVWFWLWVHLIFVVLVMGSSDFLRSRIRLGLSLSLGGLE